MELIDVSTKTFPSTFAMVDDEDFALLRQFKWTATRPHNVIYAVRNAIVDGKRTSIRMHREIVRNARVVDHWDGNGLNNKRDNLRVCTVRQNSHNTPKTRGTSFFKGVSWHAGELRWRATIVVCSRQKHLGYFDDEVSAALAYDAAAMVEFGSFARLNFEVSCV